MGYENCGEGIPYTDGLVVWTPPDHVDGCCDEPEAKAYGRPAESTIGAPAVSHLQQSFWRCPAILQNWHSKAVFGREQPILEFLWDQFQGLYPDLSPPINIVFITSNCIMSKTRFIIA
jgi:hypothetical protein